MTRNLKNFVQLVQTVVIMMCKSPQEQVAGISLLSAVQNMKEEGVPTFYASEIGVPEANSAAYMLVEWALSGFNIETRPAWFDFEDEAD